MKIYESESCLHDSLHLCLRHFVMLAEEQAGLIARGLYYRDARWFTSEFRRIEESIMIIMNDFRKRLADRPAEYWLMMARRKIHLLQLRKNNQLKSGTLTEKDEEWFCREIDREEKKIAEITAFHEVKVKKK